MQMLRRVLALALCLALAWPASLPVVFAQSPVEVSLVPSSSEVTLGNTFTVAINLANCTDVIGADVQVVFDPTKLQVVDSDALQAGVQIAPGSFIVGQIGANTANNTAGTVRFAVAKAAPGVDGAGTLATITFAAVGEGTATIGFPATYPVDLLDSAFDELAYTLTPAAVTLSAPVVPPVEVTLVPDSTAVTLGQTFDVAVNLAECVDVIGADVQITFDPTKLQVVDADALQAGIQMTPGSLIVGQIGANTANNEAGTARFAVAKGAPGIDGAGTLFTVTFTAIAEGTAVIGFPAVDPVEILDSNWDYPNYTATPVSVVITSSIRFDDTIPTLVNNPSLTVTGTYTDPTATAAFVMVNPDPADIPGAGDAATLNPTAGTFSKSVTLVEGSNVLVAVLVAGDQVVGQATYQVTLQTAGPVITIGGVTDGEYYNLPVTPTISITGDNVDPASIQETIRLPDDSIIPFIHGTEYTAEGSYTVMVAAEDFAGNETVTTCSFVIDTTPPVVVITGVQHGDVYGAAVTPVFSITDANLDAAKSGATLQVGAAEPVAFQSGTTISTSGGYTLRVFGEDLAGGTTVETVTFSIVLEGPVISITGVVDGNHYKQDVALSASATHPNMAPGFPTYALTRNSEPVAYPGGPITLSDEGTYALSVIAEDTFGRRSEEHITFVIDKTAPVVTVDGLPATAFTATPFTPVFGVTDANLDTWAVTVTRDGQPFAWVADQQITGDGTYVFVVSGSDLAGNTVDSVLHTYTFTLDRTPPELLVTGMVGAWSNAAFTPVFNVTDANLVSASVMATVTKDGVAFPWVAAQVIDEEGRYVFTVTAEDEAGNTLNEVISHGLDTTLPTVSIVRPANGSRVGPTGLVVEATVVDVLSGIDPDSIELRINGTLRQHTFNPTTGSVSFAYTAADGDHSVTLSVRDNAGNQAAAGTWQFTVDSNAPVTTLVIDPQQPDGLNGWYRTVPEISFTVEPTDSIIKYAFHDAGTDPVWSLYVPATQLTVPPTVIRLSYYAEDAHTGLTEAVQSIDLLIDTIPPTIDTVGHDRVGQHLKAGQSVTLTMTGEAGCTASFSIPGVTAAQNVAMVEGPGGTYTGVYTVLDGDNVADAMAAFKLVDQAGNETTQTATQGLTFDTVPPVITVFNATGLREGVTRTAPLKAGDAIRVEVTTEAGALVAFGIGTEVTGVAVPATAPGANTYMVEWVVPDGVNVVAPVSVTVTDLAGNATTQATQESFTLDTTPPLLSSVSHSALLPVKGGAQVKITVYGEANRVVEYKIGIPGAGTQSEFARITDAVLQGVLPQTTTSGKYEATITIPSDVDVPNATLAARITDPADNVTDGKAWNPITIDNTPPEFTSFTVAPARILKAGDTLTVTLVGTPNVRVRLDINGWRTALTMTETPAGSGTYVYTAANLQGVNFSASSLVATMRDLAGNETVATDDQGLVVDTEPPGTTVTISHNPAGRNGWYVVAPTVTMTPEPGATVHYSVNGAPEAQSATTVEWTAPTAAPTTYTITWYSVDAAGNSEASVLSLAERTLTLKVDTQDPAPPVITAFAPALTNQTTATVTGTTEPGASVDIFRNGAYRASVTADGAGAFTYQATLLEGNNAFTARAARTLGSGRMSAIGAAQNITRDTRGPVFTFGEPTIAAGNATVRITASEPVDGLPTVSVKVEDGADTPVVPTPTGTANQWDVTFAFPLDASTYTLTVTGDDVLGNAGRGDQTRTIVQENPADWIRVNISGLNVLEIDPRNVDRTLTLLTGTTAENSDDTGALLASGIGHAFNVSDEQGNPVTQFPFPLLMRLPLDPELRHESRVYYWYEGQWKLFEGSVEIVQMPDGSWAAEFWTDHLSMWMPLADVTPPTLTLTAPADASLVASHTLDVAFTIADGGAKYEIWVNGVKQVDTAIVADGAFAEQVTLQEGPNTVKVVALDAVGNAAEAQVLVTADTIPPVITVTTPALGTDGGSISVGSANVAVAGSTEPNSTVTLSLNSGAAVSLGSTGTFNTNVTLNPGANTLRFVATDLAGNVGTATYTVVFDNVPPPITGVSPSDGTVTAQSSITVSGTSEAGATIVIKKNGAVDATLTNIPTASFSQAVSLPADGIYVIDIEASDQFGNTSSHSFAVTRDQTVPVITITSPTTVKTNQNSATVTGNVAGSTVILVRVGTDEQVVGVDGDFSASINLPADGAYTVEVEALNAAGTKALTTVSITRDTVPPVLNVTAPDSVVNAATVTISGTTEAGAVINVTATAGNVTTTADPSGAFSVVVNLDYGTNSISITAADDLGNTSAAQTFSVIRPTAAAPSVGVPAPSPANTASPTQGVTVTVPTGEFRLVVPTGAVGTSVSFQVTTLTSPTVPVTQFRQVGRVFRVVATDTTGKSITQFAAPLTFSVDYSSQDLAGVDPADLRLMYWNVSAGAWVAVPAAHDPITKTFTASIDHLTMFALMADVADVRTTLAAPPDSVGGQRLVVSGTAPAGSSVEVFVNNQRAATVTADTSGSWAKAVQLAEGKNRVFAVSAVGSLKRASTEYVVSYAKVTLTDVAQHWARTNVEELVGLGIVTGYPDKSFQPDRTVNRAEFVAMLAKALELAPKPDAQLGFSDAVPEWAKGYVAAAVEKGIVTGFEDNTFRASQEITRAQMATMISRALALKGDLTTAKSDVGEFADSAAIPEWAKAHITAAAEYKIITGYPDSTFGGSRQASRAEAATMILRLFNLK